MKWAPATLAMLVAVAVTSIQLARAEAAPAPLELVWDVPPGCPDAASVLRRVEQILRAPPTAPERMIATGVVRKVGEVRFQLTLTMRTGDVERARMIEDASCSALAEASAVAISLAIDPEIDPNKEGDAGGTNDAAKIPALPAAPTPTMITPAAVTRPPPSRVAGEERPRPRIALGVGAVVALGTLPDLAGGVSASAALDYGRLRLGVLGTFSFRQRPIFDPVTGAGAAFDEREFGVFGAYMLRLGSFAVGPAANLELTSLRVEGFGIRAPRAQQTMWTTAALGARGELDLWRFVRAFARADLLVPFGAPRVILGASGSQEQLYEPGLPAARFTLGAEIVLP